MVTALLARDGVASVAKVWPEASQDKVFKIFVSGGMPICSACSKRVFDTSLAAMLQQSEPTCTLDKLEEYDDLSTYMIEEDLATLFVRAVMSKGCNREPNSRACYLCNNRQEFEHHLSSQEWQAVSTQYAARLATDLTDLYNDHLDSRYGVPCDLVLKLLPGTCLRCGTFECDESSSCEWICGEDVVAQQMQQQLLEQHMTLLKARGPCGCRRKKKEPDNIHKRCACACCNNTAPELCDFCGKCCRAVYCSHNGGPLQPQIRHRFVKYIDE